MNCFKKGLPKLKMKETDPYHIFCQERTKEPSFYAKLGYEIFTDATWKLEF